jgi:hypothetical protein
MQYHVGRGTVYELQVLGDKLSLKVSPRATEADLDDWRVEAVPGHGSQSMMIDEWSSTRAGALEQVGRTWNQQAPGRGLPAFDWTEVARLLVAVSAI